MTYNRWDIILVTFPFTDLRAIKKRPALIISPDDYNLGNDVIVAFITSNLNIQSKPGDYKIKQWMKSNLPKPSMIRMKLVTIDKSIIIKKIGELQMQDVKEFNKIFLDFFLIK